LTAQAAFFVAQKWGEKIMAKVGRPRKPTNLRVLEGNPGKRPIPENEVKPKPVMPICPKMLKGEALEEWNRISVKLQELGLLTEIDNAALAAYCQCYARWMQAEDFLEKYSHDANGNFNGFMIKAPSGYLQQLPQVSIAQRYAKLMSDYLGKFGLSPADRAGLVAPKAPEKANKFSQTLSG